MSRNKNKASKSSDNSNSENKTDMGMFLTVFSYCVLIIFLPIIAFFGSKIILENFEFSSLNSNIYSAIIAVVFLHLALGLYLFRAYSDSGPPSGKSSLDKQD